MLEKSVENAAKYKTKIILTKPSTIFQCIYYWNIYIINISKSIHQL
jgi:hypothetical protein